MSRAEWRKTRASHRPVVSQGEEQVHEGKLGESWRKIEEEE